MRHFKSKLIEDFLSRINQAIDIDGFFEYKYFIFNDCINVFISHENGGAIRLKEYFTEDGKSPSKERIKRLENLAIEYLLRFIILSKPIKTINGDPVVISFPEIKEKYIDPIRKDLEINGIKK